MAIADWKKFPDTRPPRADYYLATDSSYEGDETTVEAWWMGSEWRSGDEEDSWLLAHITAWDFMPEPYDGKI